MQNEEPHPRERPFVGRFSNAASPLRGRRAKGQAPRPSEREASKFQVLPDGGHREARAVAAAPAGAQVHRAVAQVAVHAGHVLPWLVDALGDVRLVAGTEPRRLVLVVDPPSTVREHPCREDPRVRERTAASHGRDVDALPILRQVEGDPADPWLVLLVAAQKPQSLRVLALVRVHSGQEPLPAPELGVVNALDARAGRLEGLDDPVAPFAEGSRPHLEATECVLALGPVGGHALEVRELRGRRLLRTHRAEGVGEGGAQSLEGLLDGDLVRVGVAPLVERVDPPLHELVVPEELRESGIAAAEAAVAVEELCCLVDVGTGHVTCLLVPTPTSPRLRPMRSRKPACVH